MAAGNAALPLVATYKPRCIAMCGVCAGRSGKVGLGDVVVADRLYFYDTGKLVREKDDAGNDVERVYGDLMTFNLAPEWKQRAERFVVEPSAEWLRERPLPYEHQEDWLLEQLERGATPANLPERKQRCPDYSNVIKRLWKRGLVDDGTTSLSTKGRNHVNRLRVLYPGGLPDPKPFEVHVGPIATGARVIEDPLIFDRLASSMRKVLGLEMEAAAIGAISQAWTSHALRMIVMKGVMDFADHEKNDNFKHFAARASAECLLSFLRENMPTATPGGPRAPSASAAAGSATAEPGRVTPGSEGPPERVRDERSRHHESQADEGRDWSADRASRRFEGAPSDEPAPSRTAAVGPTRIYISCSRSESDQKYLSELEVRLTGLRHQFSLGVWHRGRTSAGAIVLDTTLKRVHASDVVLLMISPNFVASEECFSEMSLALKKHEAKRGVVVPILVRPTAAWGELPLGRHQALPKNGIPVSKWDDEDDAWANVINDLRPLLMRRTGNP